MEEHQAAWDPLRMRQELEGGDFDWFASDRSGNIAKFSTAGDGYVPQAVLAEHETHQTIANEIPAPHWGSDKVWDDYASMGLFVYDWGVDHGPYRRVRRPCGEMTAEFRAKLAKITSLPRLDLDFQNCRSISEGELERGK